MPTLTTTTKDITAAKDIREKAWYSLEDEALIDSPSLIVYRDRVKENIRLLKENIQELKNLRPHVKTHKTKEATLLMMEAGIEKFKCSTIAEAEMLAQAGAKDILLAYQPVGPKAVRFVSLMKKYQSFFSCLIDNPSSLQELARLGESEKQRIPVYIDLNVGMNRTGIIPGEAAMDLYETALETASIQMMGLHVYDGHIHLQDLKERTLKCEKAFAPVTSMCRKMQAKKLPAPKIVAGGSPSFPIHASRKGVECSPGTFVFWDKGYQELLPEQPFLHAALVLSRVISLPAPGKICVDLGHKSIASEKELHQRIHFLNAPELKAISQSEEHLVLEAGKGHAYQVGDVLYGLPFHICPTCALYEKALVAEKGRLKEEWKILARNRSIEV